MPAEETQVEKCLECNLPKTGGAAGSLTQWISVCSCGLLELPEAQYETVIFCNRCSKRIVEARKGSFTQWVFRSDLCSCENPEPIERRSKKTSESSDLRISDQVFEPEDEVEIELEQASFPRERFKPLGILGQGAGGSVYLCRDRLLNKKVALKCLNYVSDQILVAFQSEARVNTRLEHPNIARVLDFGIHQETTPYMVVEYIKGFDLEFHLAQHGIPDIEVGLDIFKQLCDALAYAHSQGVLHRDVKAGNVLFVSGAGKDSKPSISVIDFGLATVKDDAVPREMENGEATVVGTPRYMSCDQARGHRYEERSEIYSLGCVAFELFTGQTPFEAETALELIRLHAIEEAPSISEVRPDIEFPEGLDQVIMRCLAKEPEDRFQRMDEVRACLDEIEVAPPESTAGEIEPGSPSQSPVEKTGKKSKREWLVLALIPLSILVVAACLALYYRLTQGSEQIEVAAREEVELVKPHSENDSELELVGEKVTFSRKEGYMHPDNILGFIDEDIKYMKGKGYKRISFYGTSIDGSGLKYLKGEDVEALSLDHTPAGDPAMKIVNDSLPNLKALYLEYNSAVTGKGLKYLTDMKNLDELTLNGNKNICDDDIKTILKNFPKITRLSLLGTSVTDRGVVQLKKLGNLSHLYLDSTNISDKSVQAIAGLPLTELLVSHTLITDRSLDYIARMKKLEFVSLANCRYVTKSGMARLNKKRPDLKIILKDFRSQLPVPFVPF